MGLLLFYLILAALFLAIARLQLKLAWEESKWLGLILPLVFAVCALRFSNPWYLSGLPALTYLAIYFGCRRRRKKRQRLKETYIRDL